MRISDKFPKAAFHALVVARDPLLQGPLDLRKKDLPLVEHMLVREGLLRGLARSCCCCRCFCQQCMRQPAMFGK